MSKKNKDSDVAFCYACQDFVPSFTQNATENVHIRGTDIQVTSPVRICKKCRQVLFDPVLDNNKIKLAYRTYRDMKGMLQPEEIRSIREQHRLSQKEFSDILGFDGKKIERYENGSLQSMAENNLIFLMKNPKNLSVLIKRYQKQRNT